MIILKNILKIIKNKNKNFMKKLSCIALIAMCFLTKIFPQNTEKALFTKNSYSKEISFFRTDTTHGSQSTVIEYADFLVVIELPIINEGGGKSTNLTEDIPKAKDFLHFIKKHYNNKPVKYVLSSHWHLHSLSGITPFFEQGATLLTAKTNWEYSIKNGLFGNNDISKYKKQVIEITKDTTILQKTNNPIQVLFLDETYTNKPTKDYLFFFMPKNKTMHASCMCAMSDIDFNVRKDFIYSDRVSDLSKAIQTRNLSVENLIKLTSEFDKEKKIYKNPTFTKDYFAKFVEKGKPMSSVVKEFSAYNLSFLVSKKDSILNHLTTKKISAQVINSTVYDCIKQKKYEQAVQWSQILNLYHAGEVNFMDTMGEAYYYAGNTTMAQHYHNLIFALKPTHKGGIETWAKNKENAQK